MNQRTAPATEGQRALDSTRYFAMVARWWWLLLAGPAIAGSAAFFITRTIAPTYRASATLLINQVETPGSIVYNDLLTSERLTTTYRELITKRPILEAAVAGGSEPGLTADQLRAKLDTTVVKDTQLVLVSVSDRSPERAARLANDVALTFVQNETSGEITRPGATRVVEQADVPSSPVSPNMRLNVALAAMMGLVFAGGLALFFEYLDDTVKSAADVEAASGLPILGEVGRWPGARREIQLSSRGAHQAQSETYAVLRTNVQFSSLARPARVFLVTSASAGDGKSTTAANFALACADAGKVVALVDTDLRRPSLHRAFGVDNGRGLTSALLKQASLDDGVLIQTAHASLFLVPSGPLPPNPAELIEWSGFDAVIEQIKTKVDLVVLDSPPVLAVADSRILAAKADATILVVEHGKTRAGALRAAYEAVARADANVLGVVLNKVRRGRRPYYNYYHYYYSSDDGRSRRNGHRSTPLPEFDGVATGAVNGHVGDEASERRIPPAHDVRARDDDRR